MGREQFSREKRPDGFVGASTGSRRFNSPNCALFHQYNLVDSAGKATWQYLRLTRDHGNTAAGKMGELGNKD